MADASRFPGLAIPFAIAGASAGWLSGGLLANPLVLYDDRFPMQLVATLVAMSAATLSGLLLRWCCIGRRPSYALDPPDPSERPKTDMAWLHAVIMLAAGTATGGIVAIASGNLGEPLAAMGIATLCTLVFVPVGFAVLAAGRRAQRARLGSIVAKSDRRAVWGILATALGVTTLEALPDWPAAAARKVPLPLPALAVVTFAGLVVGALLIADRQAKRRATAAIEAASYDHTRGADDGVPVRIDLGLGDDVGACVARSTSPYRGRDETVALVQGTPELIELALRRSIARGCIGIALLGAVACAHLAAYACLDEPAYRVLSHARLTGEWRTADVNPSRPSPSARPSSPASPKAEAQPDSQRLRCQGFVSEPRAGR